jgi:hypothetical protein
MEKSGTAWSILYSDGSYRLACSSASYCPIQLQGLLHLYSIIRHHPKDEPNPQLGQPLRSFSPFPRTRVYIDWKLQLSCIHAVMMVFRAQLAEGGGPCPPTCHPLSLYLPPPHEFRRIPPPPPQQDKRDFATCTQPITPLPYSLTMPVYIGCCAEKCNSYYSRRCWSLAGRWILNTLNTVYSINKILIVLHLNLSPETETEAPASNLVALHNFPPTIPATMD